MQQEFERLPYPLTPLEENQETFKTTAYPEVSIDILVDYLQELICTWKDTCHTERRALTRPYRIGDVSLDYRAGVAKGLEDAAADLERVLAEILDAQRPRIE
jgi:hypothetical protein